MMMVKIFMMLSRERDPETAQAILCAYFGRGSLRGGRCPRAGLGGRCGAVAARAPA
jgi:hypothetical protein